MMRLFLISTVCALSFSTSAFADSVKWSDVQSSLSPLVETRVNASFEDPSRLKSPQVKRMEQLLEKAVSILSSSESKKDRQFLMELRASIQEKQKEISSLRFAMASAPEASRDTVSALLSKVGVGQKTKESYASDIKSIESDIVVLMKKQDSVKKDFVESLNSIGVSLSESQVDGLLTVATSEEMMDMQAVFSNMKSINQELLAATIQSDESLETAKRYYGIYTVLLEVALYMHEDFLDKVDHEYLVKLSSLEKNALVLKKDAQGLLMKEKNSDSKGLLERNIGAQDLTLKTLSVYRSYLQGQRDKIESSRKSLRRQYDVAMNTYKTVQLSSDLMTLMKGSNKTFESLLSLEVPELRPFESTEMKMEFERITTELKKSS